MLSSAPAAAPVAKRAWSTPLPAPAPPEPVNKRPPKPPQSERGSSGGGASVSAAYPAQDQRARDRRPSSQQSPRVASTQKAQGSQSRTCSLPPLRGKQRAERSSTPASEPAAEAPRLQRRSQSVRTDARAAPANDPSKGAPNGSGARSAPPRVVARQASVGVVSSERNTSSSAANTAAGVQNKENLVVRREGFAKAIQEWKKRRGHPLEANVFTISGAFPAIKNALLERGWVENTDGSSPLWDMRYAMLLKDVGELTELDDQQSVNFFGRNSEISSKIGLCNNLYNSFNPACRPEVDDILPRCYDLTSTSQVESFIQDFKATSCACVVHRFVVEGGRTAESGAPKCFTRHVVRTALAVCQRRCISFDDALDDPLLPLVTDEEWRVLELCSLKNPGKKLKPVKGQIVQETQDNDQSLANKNMQVENGGVQATADANLNEAAADEAGSDASDNEAGDDANDAVVADKSVKSIARCAEDEELFLEASTILKQLGKLVPQLGLDGFQNIWILKPAGKSRGRGICLSARLEKIVEIGVGRGIESRWIAQKYMENPQIINQKKFDIRQWAVVTKWDPLSVWFYEDCYLRFSFSDYDPSKLKNKYSHLTNNSISKHAKDFEEKQDETMWHSDDYREHLKSLKIERNGSVIKDPWTEIVQPKIKAMVMRSLESVQDVVQPRSASYQLFGYDFMVSDDLEGWLIEVNSSPDLSSSTSTTRGLVKAMLDDLVKVAVDVEKFGLQTERPRRKWDKLKADTGRFVLLEAARRRREERFGKLRKAKGTGQLEIRGSGIKLRKAKRSEVDAAADPRVVHAAELADRLAAEEAEQALDAEAGIGADEEAAGEKSDEEASDASSGG